MSGAKFGYKYSRREVGMGGTLLGVVSGTLWAFSGKVTDLLRDPEPPYRSLGSQVALYDSYIPGAAS